jgi:hypothetical protein
MTDVMANEVPCDWHTMCSKTQVSKSTGCVFSTGYGLQFFSIQMHYAYVD